MAPPTEAERATGCEITIPSTDRGVYQVSTQPFAHMILVCCFNQVSKLGNDVAGLCVQWSPAEDMALRTESAAAVCVLRHACWSFPSSWVNSNP